MRLKKLPRKGHWEVALLMPPGTVDPFDGGELFVVDSTTGELRLHAVMSLQTSLSELITRAAVEPSGPHRRSRPRSLRILPGLRGDLEPIVEALGCKLVVVERLEALDALRQGPGSEEAAPTVPIGPWGPLLPGLVAAAPWHRIADGASVTVGGPELDEVTIEVDPTQGVPRLLAVPADADPGAQLEAMAAGEGDGQLVMWAIDLPPLSALGAAASAWEAAGVVVDDEGVRRALVIHKLSLRGSGRATEGEQRRLLAALELLVAALEAHPDTLPSTEARLPVPGHDAVVRYTPAAPRVDWLGDAEPDVRCVLGDDGPELHVVFADAAVAKSRAILLPQVERVHLSMPLRRSDALELELASGPHVAGRLALPLSPPTWRPWLPAETTHIPVVIRAGDEIVATHRLLRAPADNLGVGAALPSEARATQPGDVADKARHWPDLAAAVWALAEPLRATMPDGEAFEKAVACWQVLRDDRPDAGALPLPDDLAQAVREAWRAWGRHDPRQIHAWGLCEDGTAVVAWERVDGRL